MMKIQIQKLNTRGTLNDNELIEGGFILAL